MRLVCLLLLFSFSCAESEIQKEYTDSETFDSTVELDMSVDAISNSEAFLVSSYKWVCHHPDTDFHNKECVENHYPDGCYISGDNHKFCWLLLRDECINPLNGNILEACRNVGYLK